ncbi:MULTISPECIES: prolyl oligopeptidase family serine peptidase [unclassified Sphingomonas]|mgnify:CR=1 FL=1|uniref:dienelactone hydrolase family protein n=1 Tax=unclassified Sphingomonas TaxID=196159 RepID=UPI000B252C6A|nr:MULTISPECIES: prolyl oligopeptidase family serine peptidase [unclassified Sphingomonas]MBN8846528.1 prolyl oligopeptidase family serine peptidase [Sphingomonas sp.]
MIRPMICGLLLVGMGVRASPAVADTQLPAISSASFATVPVVLANGVRGELVNFDSHSPVDWGPALRGNLGPAVRLDAQFFRPPGAIGKVPVTIIVPGSGNLGTHHLAEASALVGKGIAVLVIDPFHGRGIVDTIADQGRLSWTSSAYDVLAAVKYLRGRADVDPARIGALGGSRGGTAVMMAASAPFSDAILGQGHGLLAVVAGYPWCGTQFESARLARGAALLVLQGDHDDWVSLQQCQDAVHAMIVSKQNAAMHIIAGAYHAFDRADVPPTRIADAVTSTTFPTVYMDDAGTYIDLRTGKPNPALRPAQLTEYAISGGFVRKGVTIGSRPGDAAEFMGEMVSFLAAALS